MSAVHSIKTLSPAARRGETVVIVGAGLAGLFTALKLAPTPSVVISPAPLGEGASSSWAQGGIAAAISDGDTPDDHARDTIKAGAGLVNKRMARLLASEAPDRIEDLLRLGVPFDRDIEGKLLLSREAAHGARRIARVKGDLAGKAIMAAVMDAARKTDSIQILEGMSVHELATRRGRVTGVYLWPSESSGAGDPEFLPARGVVLASGGVGQLFQVTTNPSSAYGEGIAMAARAGAVIADPEFVQFHPTAVDIGRDPAPLASEALRGEGARLVNGKGERYMKGVHKDAELAPRDVVARATFKEVMSGRGAFIDCTKAIGKRLPEAFPTLFDICTSAGIDPVKQPIPIAPAAHYHMGGVLSDANGRTTVDGLWACGEVACTGAHGANRLASNSLLETVVFGARIAEDIRGLLPHRLRDSAEQEKTDDVRRGIRSKKDGAQITQWLRSTMTEKAGVVRNGETLREGLSDIMQAMDEDLPLSFQNRLITASFIVAGALAREESRGSQFRTDHPKSRKRWKRHTYLTLEDVQRIHEEANSSRVEPGNVIHASFGRA